MPAPPLAFARFFLGGLRVYQVTSQLGMPLPGIVGFPGLSRGIQAGPGRAARCLDFFLLRSPPVPFGAGLLSRLALRRQAFLEFFEFLLLLPGSLI